MKKIFTHTDFDGAVSAALVSIATNVDFIKFISANKIWSEQFTGDEIICDLPCPWKCKLWFDHHEANLKEMEARGVDVKKIEGEFDLQPSCARVIYNYYNNKIEFPKYFNKLIDETDIIDSMQYKSIEEWLDDSPIKYLAKTMQLIEKEDYRNFVNYMIKITKLLRKTSPDELVRDKEVQKRYHIIKEYQKNYLEIIKNALYYKDNEKDIIIIDISDLKYAPRLDKNLAYILNPNANAILLINSIFKNNTKSNDLRFSMGINFTKPLDINLSRIFEEIGLGGGHQKAAGGILTCSSKGEKLEKKKIYIDKIIGLWKKQKNS